MNARELRRFEISLLLYCFLWANREVSRERHRFHEKSVEQSRERI